MWISGRQLDHYLEAAALCPCNANGFSECRCGQPAMPDDPIILNIPVPA